MLLVKSPLFYLTMAPKPQGSDMGNSDLPKKPQVPFFLTKKVKVFNLIRKGRETYAEVAKLYNKNKSSVREIVANEKEIHVSLAVTPQTEKVKAAV